MKRLKFTVLGSGSSFGTPAAGNVWGDCDPAEPRNRRHRASLLVESAATKILIDATPDLRHQSNDFLVDRLDAVLLSHAHSDHVNGIDDVRPFALKKEGLVDVYGNKETIDEVERRWPYAFDGNSTVSWNFCKSHVIPSFGDMTIGDISFSTFAQEHGQIQSLGFRFGDVAYSVDMNDLPKKSLEVLEGVKIWIVDACRYKNPVVKAHANLERVFQWVERLKPEMTYLTVLSTMMDYQTLLKELPPHIRPVHDGLVIEG